MVKIIDDIKIILEKNHEIEKEELVNLLEKKTCLDKKIIELRITKSIIKKELDIKNNKISLPIIFDEEEQLGPFKISRKGRQIMLKNESKKSLGDLDEKELIKISNENEQKLYDTLDKIEKMLLTLNPFKVLADLFFKYNTKTSDELGKNKDELTIIYEIVQKLILKHNISEFNLKAENNKIDDLYNLLEKFKFDLIYYTIFITGKESKEIKLCFHIILSTYLIVRGEAQAVHYTEINTQLLDYTKSCFNSTFNSEFFLKTINEIISQISNNIKTMYSSYSKTLELIREESKKRIKKDSIDEFKKNNSELIKKATYELLNYEENFKINLNQNIKKEYLNFISLNFGDNKKWKKILDYDLVITNPLIKYNNDYYCFLPQNLLRNLKLIFENLVSDKSLYFKLKGQFYENKVKECFEKILNPDKFYQNNYDIFGNENDLLFIKNNILFIVEVKGKKRRLFSDVSDIIQQTKEDFDESIYQAFEQVNSTFDYINNYSEVIFYDSNNKKKRKEKFRLKKENFNKIFKLSIHADSFFSLTSCSNQIKSINKDYFDKSKDFLTLNIYDLMIFRDLIENYQDFIDYIEQRLKINITNELIAFDELDLFGYFLLEGNLIKAKDFIGKQNLINDFSEKIDLYYYNLIEGKKIEKPKRKK
ncbi:MAG: hypothetical protein WC376_02625 [Candidatus Nanoarchaeia archaeon]